MVMSLYVAWLFGFLWPNSHVLVCSLAIWLFVASVMSLHAAPIQGFLSNFLPNERGGGARHYQLYDENICDQPVFYVILQSL